jgi:hypothetical protein
VTSRRSSLSRALAVLQTGFEPLHRAAVLDLVWSFQATLLSSWPKNSPEGYHAFQGESRYFLRFSGHSRPQRCSGTNLSRVLCAERTDPGSVGNAQNGALLGVERRRATLARVRPPLALRRPQAWARPLPGMSILRTGLRAQTNSGSRLDWPTRQRLRCRDPPAILECTPKLRQQVKGRNTLNGERQWICPELSTLAI